jgi:hypothetical protein
VASEKRQRQLPQGGTTSAVLIVTGSLQHLGCARSMLEAND